MCECLDVSDSLWPHGPLSGSSVHGIFQARILEWVVIFSSRGSSQPKDQIHVSCIDTQILYHWATWEACFILKQISYTCILNIVICIGLIYNNYFAWLLPNQIKYRSITINKASGSEGIPVDLLQILKVDAVKELHSIFQQSWKTQQWPGKPGKGQVVSSPKERQCQRKFKLPHNCTHLTC